MSSTSGGQEVKDEAEIQNIWSGEMGQVRGLDKMALGALGLAHTF